MLFLESILNGPLEETSNSKQMYAVGGEKVCGADVVSSLAPLMMQVIMA